MTCNPELRNNVQLTKLRPDDFLSHDVAATMLKIRILAVLIAILLTLLLIYIVPKLIYAYVGWTNGFSGEQQNWFHWSQVLLGVLLALFGFWRWRKSKAKK